MLRRIDGSQYAPSISRKAAQPWNKRIWKFFGLTQQYQYDLISQTRLLLSLIHHKNLPWLVEVRNGKVEVHYAFAGSDEPINFRILRNERFCNASRNAEASDHAAKAWELLKAWGMFDLPLGRVKFVLASRSEESMEKKGFEMASSELREVRIERIA
jgi:hypothetical protein